MGAEVRALDAKWAAYVAALKRLHAASPGSASHRKAEAAELKAWEALQKVRP